MWSFQPTGGQGGSRCPPQVEARSSVHPAAADDASDNGNDDGDGATMDVAPLGTVESVQAGAVGEIRPEPKTTYRLATTVRGLQIRLRSKTRGRSRSRSRSRSITRSRSPSIAPQKTNRIKIPENEGGDAMNAEEAYVN